MTAIILAALVLNNAAANQETFTPYRADNVPQTVTDLWKDYDPRSEDLEVQVLREWRENGVVSRYVTFKVGTFKGAEARIAAYYCFPDNGRKNPAFVWCHGGGQRADRSNGDYFARQGFATIDISWLGRPLEEDLDENTDWGNVDPTQGPKFYAQAKRQHWKRNLQPDEYTIDPVPSPRNSNWFLLVVAAKRAITFLEQQPEVDPDRIGLAGFSMGGTVTAMTAIDPRLKAVAPFVGGTGFLHEDFPGGAGGPSIRVHYRGPEMVALYSRTIDPAAYWPLVKCPVVFISSSNDFHAAFDRIFQSLALLPHRAWRVSVKMHDNHGPGPEQWILLIKWFNQYLKGSDQQIPVTPPSTLAVNGSTATFTVTPENRAGRLRGTEIYYSYDPNPLTRFWHWADANRAGDSYTVDLAVHERLPLYVFALCRYDLGEEAEARREKTSTLTVTSVEQSIVPDDIDLATLADLANSDTVDDFRHGFRDWSVRSAGEQITTYKFQSPYLERGNDRQLVITIDPPGRPLSLRLRAEGRFLGPGRDRGNFSWVRPVTGQGPREVVIDRLDFKGDTDKQLEWPSISRFFLSVFDETTKTNIDLQTEEAAGILRSIKLVPRPAKPKE